MLKLPLSGVLFSELYLSITLKLNQMQGNRTDMDEWKRKSILLSL